MSERNVWGYDAYGILLYEGKEICDYPQAVEALKSRLNECLGEIETKEARIAELESVLRNVRDRFFPSGQIERDQDLMWRPVNLVLSLTPSLPK